MRTPGRLTLVSDSNLTVTLVSDLTGGMSLLYSSPSAARKVILLILNVNSTKLISFCQGIIEEPSKAF